MRSARIVLVLLGAGFGCQKSESKPREEPPLVTRPSVSTSTTAEPVPSGNAAPAAGAPAGPCANVAQGAIACDGDRVVRCASAGQTPEVVRTCFSIERCDAGACVAACPAGEVYIPATGPDGYTLGTGKERFGFGTWTSGNRGKGISDMPHQVVLSKPFCMDATEVTAGAYKQCVTENGCEKPVKPDVWKTYDVPEKADYPLNLVDWGMAKAYCEKRGQSLPTEAQWQWAATGGDRRKWPWGNERPTCEYADHTPGLLVSPGGDSGCHGGGPSKVATHPKGDRIWPTGAIHDLAGNVWEWTLDSYLPYKGVPETDPHVDNPRVLNRVIRGGGWNRSGMGIQSDYRGGATAKYKVPGLGFRCVRNAASRTE